MRVKYYGGIYDCKVYYHHDYVSGDVHVYSDNGLELIFNDNGKREYSDTTWIKCFITEYNYTIYKIKTPEEEYQWDKREGFDILDDIEKDILMRLGM